LLSGAHARAAVCGTIGPDGPEAGDDLLQIGEGVAAAGQADAHDQQDDRERFSATVTIPISHPSADETLAKSILIGDASAGGRDSRSCLACRLWMLASWLH
jgi:hypothetical protein